MDTKSNKISVYLVSPEVVEPSLIVEEDADKIEINGVGTFYSKHSFPRPPDWVKDFFGDKIGDHFKILTASSRGLLVVPFQQEEKTRYFAISFGHGRYFLRDDAIDERFGLKVVLNSVERNSLRSIDKTALGSVPKQSREQMSGESEFSSFGVDIEQDLVSSVTGRSKIEQFGKTITGKDALSLSAKVNVETIGDLLPLLLERFQSSDYQAEFDWIDQIKDVRTPKLTTKLDAWLLDKLKAGDFSRIWMAPPAVLDWVDVLGFVYRTSSKAELYSDLTVADLLKQLEGDELTIERIKGKRVFVKSAKTDQIFSSWTAYRCLYAEAEFAESTYILNGGRWYEIAKSFSHGVLSEFAQFPSAEVDLVEYNHTNEGEYNKALADKLAESACLDMKLVPHGGGKSRIEFCDVKTKNGKLIHVKHYGGSAQLSHLFNQGVVSAELFLQDAVFREKLNAILPEGHKLVDYKARPDPGDFEVVFAVISKSKNKLDIPFFSKVSLRNARRRLAAYGYAVSLAKISHAPGPQ